VSSRILLFSNFYPSVQKASHSSTTGLQTNFTMVLTVHHLGISQSERILFLCEELAIDYKIIHHTRDPIAAPESLKSVPGNSTGKAPFIEDPEAGITLSESAAICDYILAKNSAGELGRQNVGKKLAKSYGEPGYVDFIYWYHFSNGTLQALMNRFTVFEIGQIPEDNMAQKFSMARWRGLYGCRYHERVLAHVETVLWTACELQGVSECCEISEGYRGQASVSEGYGEG
jgi:glutathione S-transferase